MRKSPAQRPQVDDCWNRLGVWGDKACPELQGVLHCRNCEVYARAGRQLLEREPPAGYAQAWSKRLAPPEKETRHRGISVLVFRIGQEWFALPTEVFNGVLDVRPVHHIPHASNRVLEGLVNVRGRLRPCASVANLLGLEQSEPAAEAKRGKAIPRMLLAGEQGKEIVFAVSEVHGTHRYDAGELRGLPATLAKAACAYSKAVLPWHGKYIAVLDEERLLEQLAKSLS